MLILESFTKALNDSNIKICVKAIKAFEEIVPIYKTAVEQNINMIMNSIANGLSSTNSAVKNNADVLIDLLIDTVENVVLIQPLVHLALYANIRSKPLIIQHLCEILPDVYKSKPQIISKYVVHAASLLLDESKMEIKTVVVRLIQILHNLMGEGFIELLPSSKIDKVNEYLK